MAIAEAQAGPRKAMLTLVIGAGGSGVTAIAEALAEVRGGPASATVQARIQDLSLEVLESLGGVWSRPEAFAQMNAGARARTIAIWREKAVDVLEHAGDGAVAGSPAASLVLPVWLAAAKHVQMRLRLVLAHRRPLEAAASLTERHGLDHAQALRLWLASYRQILTSAPTPAAVVAYERFATRPAVALSAILRRLGAPLLAPDEGARVRARMKRGSPRHSAHSATSEDVSRAADLLADWTTLTKGERAERISEITGERRPGAWGSGPTGEPIALEARPSAPPRLLVLHYHLFKNAGTSVDAVLKRNFGERWTTVEFAAREGGPEGLAAFIAAHPDAVVVSSHTARLPPPEISGRHVAPVLFLRHPLDRLRSAYEFERRQNADTDGARLARANDFAGYVRELVARPGRSQARNFQAARLADGAPRGVGDTRSRALHTLERLPFVGLVEAFDASMAKLAELLRPMAPDFTTESARRNVSEGRPAVLTARLAAIEAELGQALHKELIEANQIDLELHALVTQSYAAADLNHPANESGRANL